MPTAWKPHLAIGVPEIDAQHRQIAGALVALDARLQRSETEAAPLALRVLSRYALEHFETEERWMRRTGFPRLVEHVRKHDDLVGRLVSMTTELGTEDPSPLFLARLRMAIAWIQEHMETEDQLLGRHLADAAAPRPAAAARR